MDSNLNNTCKTLSSTVDHADSGESYKSDSSKESFGHQKGEIPTLIITFSDHEDYKGSQRLSMILFPDPIQWSYKSDSSKELFGHQKGEIPTLIITFSDHEDYKGSPRLS